MAGKKRITRAEQDKARESLRPDTPLPKSKTRCTKKRPTYGDLKTVELLTAVGMPMHVIASECGCSRDTLARWVREYSDIAAALAKGKSKRSKRAFACFFQQAFPIDSAGKPTGKGNPALMQFWMKVKEGMSEKASDELAVEKAKRKGKDEQGGREPPTIIYNLRKPVVPEDEPID